MRHFIEVTFKTNKGPCMIAVEEIQVISEAVPAPDETMPGCFITLSDSTVHCRESYAEIKAKLLGFNN